MKIASKAIVAIAAMLSLCVSAAAQTQTTNTITTQSVPALPAGPSPPPPPVKSTGRPHSCGIGYYPKEAIRLGLEGTTTLGFTITSQGSVTDIKVVTSSGTKALDDASILCAATWLYIPAKKNGQPIDTPWKASIAWALGSVPLEAEGWTNNCPASLLPKDGSITPNGQLTSVFYHIAADGSVRDAVVSESSGSDPLDQLIVKCVSQWRYQPPMRNGQPVEILAGVATRIPLKPGISTEIINSPREIGPGETCHRPASTDKPAGDTVLVLEVQRNGIVKNTRVWQSSGSNSLDAYAVSCASAMKFLPAYQERQAIEVTIPLRLAW